MGKDIIGPHFHEIKQRSKNFRSILATKKIYKNKELTFSNIALKRTSNYTTSLSSKYFYKVLGKRAKMNIQVNEKILFKKLKNKCSQ